MRYPLHAMFIVSVLLFAPSCSSDTPTNTATPPDTAASTVKPADVPTNAARIAAEPNPVPEGAGLGTTTVTWDTADGSWAQVYLAVQGQPEVLFVEGATGSKSAPWIAGGTAYEFRLYAGREHTRVLATVTVRRDDS